MDKINGPNFGLYDPQYLKITQRETPQSIKPNVFKETTEDQTSTLQNLTKDMVSLSAEAQEFIRLLKKYGKNSAEVKSFLKDEDMKKLIGSYKQLRELVYDEDEEEEEDPATGKKRKKNKLKGKPALPNVMSFQLSRQVRQGKGGGRQMDWNRIRQMLDAMIVYCNDENLRKTLILELEPLEEQVINSVKSFGVKIIVLPKLLSLPQLKIKGMSLVGQGERTFDGRPWDVVRGIYCQDRRIIVIGEERIGLMKSSTARHEFAHAFDHAFSQTHHRRLPLSVQLWNLFRDKRGGLVSEYASTNPMEYFAECVESFFIPSGKTKLMEKDPLMHDYLEKLFKGEIRI
jgi:hypothetical protein